MGDTGASALRDALRHNSTLSRCTLQRNRLANPHPNPTPYPEPYPTHTRAPPYPYPYPYP